MTEPTDVPDEPTEQQQILAAVAGLTDIMKSVLEDNRRLEPALAAALLRIEAQTEADRERTEAEKSRTKAEEERTAAELRRVKADENRSRDLKWAIAAGIAVILVFGAALLDNQRAIEANNRQWCPVLGALISGPPSNTPRGEWIREVFGHLFTDYGCTPEDIGDIPDVPTPSPTPDQT